MEVTSLAVVERRVAALRYFDNLLAESKTEEAKEFAYVMGVELRGYATAAQHITEATETWQRAIKERLG